MRSVVEPMQLGPGKWQLPPLPDSDTAALRRLAADSRELHAALGVVVRDAEWVLSDLRRDWQGPAAAAAPVPLQQLAHDVTVVRRALDVLADELDRLAGALDRAAEEHGWSWRKAAMVGAVVAVSVGAVIVTVGSAGTASPGAAAAETAVVSVAAGEMAAASASAATAQAAAVEGLLLAARLARTVEALRAIVVPRLAIAMMRAPVWAETPIGAGVITGGSTAAIELVDEGRIDPRVVLLTALLGAGESYVLSPGRSRGHIEHTSERLARMEAPAWRRELLRIIRAKFPQDVRPYSASARQLRTHHKRAEVLGVPARYNSANSAAFDRALRDFVANPSTVRINGKYRGQPAIFYADFDTRAVVVCGPDGSFRSAMNVTGRKRWHLWHDHEMGGG